MAFIERCTDLLQCGKCANTRRAVVIFRWVCWKVASTVENATLISAGLVLHGTASVPENEKRRERNIRNFSKLEISSRTYF